MLRFFIYYSTRARRADGKEGRAGVAAVVALRLQETRIFPKIFYGKRGTLLRRGPTRRAHARARSPDLENKRHSFRLLIGNRICLLRYPTGRENDREAGNQGRGLKLTLAFPFPLSSLPSLSRPVSPVFLRSKDDIHL